LAMPPTATTASTSVGPPVAWWSAIAIARWPIPSGALAQSTAGRHYDPRLTKNHRAKNQAHSQPPRLTGQRPWGPIDVTSRGRFFFGTQGFAALGATPCQSRATGEFFREKILEHQGPGANRQRPRVGWGEGQQGHFGATSLLYDHTHLL
jgi:hypothetical protein